MRRCAIVCVLVIAGACSPKVRWFRPYRGDDGGVGQGGAGGQGGGGQGGGGCEPRDGGSGAPGEPVILVSGQEPLGFAIDATHVYWTSGNQVMKVPKKGGTPITVASNESHPGSLAVDDTSVYWTDGWSNTVKKAPKDGGFQVLLASSYSPSSVVLDDAYVYWTGDVNLMRVSKNGGGPVVIAPQSSVDAIDSSWLYRKDRVYVEKLPAGGGLPIVLAAYGPAFSSLPHGTMVVDSTNIYWADDYNGTVMAVPKDGGDRTTLAFAQIGLHGIAIDSEYLYWALGDDKAVLRKPLQGGTAETFVSTDPDVPVYLATDCDSVYVATFSTIVRVDK